MSTVNEQQASDAVRSILGKCIKSATSSLNSIAFSFSDGSGMLVQAQGDMHKPEIVITCPKAEQIPQLSEAVCAVDWGWICGSIVRQGNCSSQKLQLKLEPAGPLTISVAVWQSAPFLTFLPYRPANRT